MAGRTKHLICLILTILLILTACDRTDSWNISAVKALAASDVNSKKEKIFSKKILPYLKARHSTLLRNFENCSCTSITEDCYLPVIRAAIIKELKSAPDSVAFRKTVELYKIVTKDSLAVIPERKEVVDSIIISELKKKLESNREVTIYELIALILALPEEKSVIANLQGLLCSDLKSEPEAVSRKRALETVNAAF
ncbi:MAG: hypothetical protein JNL74_12045 [Fibrobacteres bacterium]|nr:hypothetical protein [Fibrobacterota bacterium]